MKAAPQKHGCIWWLGQIVLAIIVFSAMVSMPGFTLILIGIVIIAFSLWLFVDAITKLGYGTVRPPLRRGKRGQPRWSMNHQWWWDGTSWTKPESTRRMS